MTIKLQFIGNSYTKPRPANVGIWLCGFSLPKPADSAICTIFVYKEIQFARIIALPVYTFRDNALAANWDPGHLLISGIYLNLN